jgi:hypothetical protein
MSTDPTIFLALDVKHSRYSIVPTEKRTYKMTNLKNHKTLIAEQKTSKHVLIPIFFVLT